jgi:hypothetical protein
MKGDKTLDKNESHLKKKNFMYGLPFLKQVSVICNFVMQDLKNHESKFVQA